jgi:MerR family transcriptional regulator, thiopeptide resistance regulator
MSEITVGALATRTGITVRTLHHYDSIGLLKPSGRTDAGYRLYADRDILRLEQIVVLRGIGLTLPEVSEILSGSPEQLRHALETHAADARRRSEEMRTLAERLEHMTERLHTHRVVSIDEAISTIQVVNVFEKYFDRDQMDAIRKHANEIGADVINDAQAEWPRLIGAVRHEMQSGTPPDAPQVAALAKRWQELIDLFMNNRPDIGMAAGRMMSAEPSMRAQMGLDADVVNYIAEATAALSNP